MHRLPRQFLPTCLLIPFAWPLLSLAAEPPTAPGVIGWRGDGAGIYPGANPPTQWDSDAGKNIRWRTKVGKGQSTPVVAAGRVFLTAEPDLLMCLDRTSGKMLWTKENGYAALPPGTNAPEKLPPTSPNCGYASATPVTDGKSVYATFGTGIAVCYDLEGGRKWIRYLDLPQITQYGRSASPVLADGKLLVSLSGLTALEPQTGATLWDAPAAKSSYGTPALVKLGDAHIAVTPTGDCVRVADGKILATKLASMKYTSPLAAGNVVYFVDASTVAYRLSGPVGEKIEPERLWENDDVEGEFFASPVCCDGILYCVSNEGTLYALDAKTGKLQWKRELEIRSASGKPGAEPANLYPSPILAGRHLLVGNDAGEMLLLVPGGQYKEAGRASLAGGSGATPVPDGDCLFLRGGRDLYCIGSK